ESTVGEPGRGSGVVDHQRCVVGPTGVVAGSAVHLGGARTGGELGRGQLVVDPPAGVVVEGLAALRPPGVRAGAVAVAGAVDVHPSQLLGEPVQVGALLGQGAGGLQVALPVLYVPLGVGDVDVPGEDHVPSVGPERFEVLHHDVEE